MNIKQVEAYDSDMSTVLGREINIYGSAEDQLFSITEIASWLEYPVDSGSGLAGMLAVVSKENQEVVCVDGQTMVMVNEDGLYQILYCSNSAIARSLRLELRQILQKAALVEEMIPASLIIDIMHNPDRIPSLIKQLKEAQKVMNALAVVASMQASEIEDLELVLNAEGIEVTM